MDKKNIYQKLAEARNMLRLRNIKPTGKNQGRFEYYELEDILPAVTEICEKVGILPVMNYFSDRAVLTIYDTDSDRTITLESPMSTAKLAGCHEVQNLGAVQTYEKRYLYMHAFDVAESDVLDGTVHTDETPRRQNAKPAPVQKAEPKPQQKKPADIAEYLLQKGLDAEECAKAGRLWDEAKDVLSEADIKERKSEFRLISTNEELIDWNRGTFWRIDAAHKLQDAQIEGNNEPEFVDDSPTLYDNEEENK
jgi:hypothetical protein